MESRWWSAWMMLASMMLLHWATSSAQPHHPRPSDLAPPHRVRRDLPAGSRDKADKVLNTVKDSLSLFKDVMAQVKPEKVVGVMKHLSNFASLAPGIGGLVSSVISMILIFIPQEDPVLKEVKEGFAEINRKLDSLSIQISDLATDVEWFNYVSVYSQDELKILNSWRKFHEFMQSNEDKVQLAEILISYYENTGAETGMTNLYHYLTVTSTSLSGNINYLLQKKFKCDIKQIGKYNFYLSSLLWKGMVVNQFYWKLIGFNSTVKEAEHSQMFKKVSEAQMSTLNYCLHNYSSYMKKDVEEITKRFSPNKEAITDQVKKKLDQKYNWYDWVVLVYDADKDSKYKFLNVKKIQIEKIVVAVGYTQKVDREGDNSFTAFCMTTWVTCDSILDQNLMCFKPIPYVKSQYTHVETLKVIHVTCEPYPPVNPNAVYQVDCEWDQTVWGRYNCKAFIYYNWNIPVCKTCKNSRKCERLLDSNESLCECQDGYYGDNCEKKIPLFQQQNAELPHPHKSIKTVNSKLDKIINILQKHQ